jgi:hypothetical protein
MLYLMVNISRSQVIYRLILIPWYVCNQTGLRSELRQYLDAVEMHDWLEHFDTNYWGIKANSGGVTADGQRIIVVFVYDLASPGMYTYIMTLTMRR